MSGTAFARTPAWQRPAWRGAGAALLLGAVALAAGALMPRTPTPGVDATPAHAASPDAAPTAAVARHRLLQFRDRTDGGIDIVDAASGRPIDQAHGEQGFLRGTLRAMARERRSRGVGVQAPLQLALDTDGRLALVDPATATRIELDAFGPTNAAVFARWLAPQGDRP